MKRNRFSIANVFSLLICIGTILLSMSDVCIVGINIWGHEFMLQGQALAVSRGLIVAAALVLPGWWLIRRTRESMAASTRERRRNSRLCPACGHNLIGNTSVVCSECGKPVLPKAEAVT